MAFAQTNASQQLNALLNNFTTYQAKFTQRTYSPTGRVIQESQGRVTIQRPGKFRWETQKPSQQLLIVNGDTFWNYDVDLMQATQQKLAKNTLNPSVLLSRSFKQWSEFFKVSTEQDQRHLTWYVLKPKQSNQSFQQVAFLFRRGRLIAMKINNNLQQLSLFLFTKIKINKHLDPNLFIFKAPAGVEVIQQ